MNEPAQARAPACAGDGPLLRVRDLRIRFGGLAALDGVSFDVTRGRTVGIIGQNGAGKTTLFNCLSGIYRPDSGDIQLDGRSLRDEPAHRVAGCGIARTFQHLALFQSLSVRDHVMLGGFCRGRTGFLGNALKTPAARREERELGERAEALISLLGLDRVATANVTQLPLLLRKRVEVARALAAQPRLLLLDEPASGLNFDEAETLRELLESLAPRFALTLLVIEHRLHLVMRISQQVVALDFGRKIADGTPDEVRTNPDVVRAYLGDGA